jgi:tetratricopeptide (TPR) repeat protein
VAEVDADQVDRAGLRSRGWSPGSSSQHWQAFNMIEQAEELRGPAALGQRPDPWLPTCLGIAGEIFVDLDWLEGARAVYAEAAGYYRRLDAIDPREHGSSLAFTLRELRSVLIKLHRYVDALPVVREELETYLRVEPTGDGPDTARYWLVEVLTGLGRNEEAAQAAGEAVAAVRRWPRRRSGAPKSVALIGALTVYAERLDRIGRFDEALTATAEYTALWRRRSEPIAYAAALDELGRRLAAVGRHRDAEVQYGRMLAIVRDLPPSRWNRRALAAALTNYAIRLGTLGRHRDAEVAAAEAVRTHREVVAATRDEAAENEAKRVAFRDSDEYDGHIDWAYDASDAEERRRDAAAIRTAELNLCIALVNHGTDLHRLGRLDESHATITEAIGMERDRRPEAAAHLATALNSLSVLWTDLNRPEEAVTAAEESVAAHEHVADDEGLAMARNSLAAALLTVGRLDEALAASTAALDAYRRFAADEPARFDGRLADALCDQGRLRSARGEHAAAAGTTAESVAIFRRLAEADPGRYDHECARALRVFAEVRHAAGADLAAARAAAGEAVERYERLVAQLPEAYGPDLERARTVRDAFA